MINIVVKLAVLFRVFSSVFRDLFFSREFNRIQELLLHHFMEVDEYNFHYLGLNRSCENSSLPGVLCCNVSVVRLTSLTVQV